MSPETRRVGPDRGGEPLPRRHAAEYVVPLRWSRERPEDVPELAGYLRGLVELVDVTVVDSSPPTLFAAHARAWDTRVRHLPVGPWPGRNGKVAGVVTGVRAARHEAVVIADDDVRYGPAALAAVLERLAAAELVSPQNVFAPARPGHSLPWHARWDTARSLLNRTFGADHPGTFALRRSAFLAMGGYAGDVLFENLELRRTVRAAGGRACNAPDVFVHRLPPSTGHFLRQRVRQAYDDLGQPVRLGLEAAVLPAVLARAVRHRRCGGHPGRAIAAELGVAAVLAVLAAEFGRRRHGGRSAFPATAALWAPAWMVERACCVWLALARRPLGGVRYSDGRLPVAAHSLRWLRRRSRQAIPLRPEPATRLSPEPAHCHPSTGVAATRT